MKFSKRISNPRAHARSVLAELQIKGAPIPVDYIAERRGIHVRRIKLEDGLSGMIFLKDSQPIVVINANHHRNRQRFTLAHEIGHFELHMHDIGSEIHVDKKFYALARDANSSMGFDRKEIEANRFAAELLVPRDMLAAQLKARSINIGYDDSIDEITDVLAQAFDVSRQMMAIRIGELLG